jgi:hypothetical protein
VLVPLSALHDQISRRSNSTGLTLKILPSCDIIRSSNGLRKEAVGLVAGRSKDIDIPHHVYGWLFDDQVPATREDLLFEAKQKVCSMIGPKFKMLGYRAAVKIHV